MKTLLAIIAFLAFFAVIVWVENHSIEFSESGLKVIQLSHKEIYGK